MTVLEASSLTWVLLSGLSGGPCDDSVSRPRSAGNKGQILHKQKSMLKGACKALGQMFSAAPLSHCLCGLGPSRVCKWPGPKTAERASDTASNYELREKL